MINLKKTLRFIVKKNNIICLIPIIIFSFFVLVNLNNRVMYADESVTAMLGKNILTYGLPKAWDGKNLVMAGVNGNEFNESLIYIRDNWLAYYIAAAGQYIANFLGADANVSVLFMRIIFSIFSIIGIVLFYFLVKDISKSTRITFFSLLLYATSIPIILHFRSIYYVALVPTLVISTVLFYRKVIERLSWKYCFGFIISSILLFHCLFVHFFIVILSLGTIYIFFDRKRINIRFCITSLLLIALFTLPWWLYQRSFLDIVEKNIFTRNNNFFQTLIGYLWQIHAYYFPFITVGAIAVILLIVRSISLKNHKSQILKIKLKVESLKTVFIIAIPCIYNVIIISYFSSFLETRWLVACVPFIFVASAYLFDFIIKQSKFIGALVLTLVIMTNFFHIAPYLLIKSMNIDCDNIDYFIKPPIPFYDANDSGWSNQKATLDEYIDKMCFVESYPINFIEEIFNDYHNADEGIIKFLNLYADETQTVYLFGYQYETFAYYNNIQLINRMDPNLNPQPNFYNFYPNATLYYNLTYQSILSCDWIIDMTNSFESHECYSDDLFEKIYIAYPNVESWNEIWAHHFYTDYSSSGIYIYRNKKTTRNIDVREEFSFE